MLIHKKYNQQPHQLIENCYTWIRRESWYEMTLSPGRRRCYLLVPDILVVIIPTFRNGPLTEAAVYGERFRTLQYRPRQILGTTYSDKRAVNPHVYGELRARSGGNCVRRALPRDGPCALERPRDDVGGVRADDVNRRFVAPRGHDVT